MTRKDTSRSCRCDDLEARLQRMEELARSNRRELDIQSRRIADLQAALDSPLVHLRRKHPPHKPDGNGDSRATDR